MVEFENRGSRAMSVHPVPGMSLVKPQTTVESAPAVSPMPVDSDYPKILEVPKVQELVVPHPVYTTTQVGFKSKTTTAILAFFLDAKHAQKFYLGYMQSGLIYLGGIIGFSISFWVFPILF